MDHAPDLPEDIHCFWDLVDAASDQDNDIELDLHEHVALQVEPQGAASARCTPSTI
jgi:hypothetical protein